jgi:HEAT repeat protein
MIPSSALAVPATPGASEGLETGAVAAPGGGLPAASPAANDLLANIQHGDTAARYAAVKQATLVGTDAIVPLADAHGGSDPAAAKAAGEAIRRIVHHAGRPGATAETKSACAQLQRLAGKEYPREVRTNAIGFLGSIGDKDAVPALVALLPDKEVSEDARMALERIPGREADTALRTASRSMPESREALEQSLRHRNIRLKDIGTRN